MTVFKIDVQCLRDICIGYKDLEQVVAWAYMRLLLKYY